MRRLTVFLGMIALAVPAASVAARLAPGDGTLGVRNGDGIVRLNDFKGAILGRIDRGTLVIVDPKNGDCEAQLVWEADDQWSRERKLGEDKVLECVYTARTAMRFRVVGGTNTLRLNGYGIALAVVGRGTAYLQGVKDRNPDGFYSANGSPWKSLPDDGFTVKIATLGL